MYTNQPTECLNWVFLPARRKTRFLLLKTIEGWFLKQLAERKRAHTERLVTGHYITDYCHRELSASITHLAYYRTQPTNNASIFVVETVSGNSQFAVNLQARTCTCNSWKDFKVPCVHACRVIHHTGGNRMFVVLSSQTQWLLHTVGTSFLPVLKQNLVPRQGRKAPLSITQAGRPKKRRIPSRGSKEAVVCSAHGKRTKSRKGAVCSSCGSAGNHYAPTCRGVHNANA